MDTSYIPATVILDLEISNCLRCAVCALAISITVRP